MIDSSKIPDFLIGICIALLFALLVLRRASPKNQTNSGSGLGIQDAIENVRAELAASDSAATAQNRETLFKVASFDLELNFVVHESRSGEAGADLKLVTVGGKSEYSSEKVQKITIHMVTRPVVELEVKPDPTL